MDMQDSGDSTMATDDVLDGIILTHAAEVGRPFGQCKDVSYALADDLVANGYDAVVLRCSGYEGHAPAADKRWRDLGSPFYWIHYVVQVEDKVYDLTRRQFHPKAPKITVQTPKELGAEWEAVGKDASWLKKREAEELVPSPSL
jgi:hypothetical protein